MNPSNSKVARQVAPQVGYGSDNYLMTTILCFMVGSSVCATSSIKSEVRLSAKKYAGGRCDEHITRGKRNEGSSNQAGNRNDWPWPFDAIQIHGGGCLSPADQVRGKNGRMARVRGAVLDYE